jgi:hypothetical protein
MSLRMNTGPRLPSDGICLAVVPSENAVCACNPKEVPSWP